MEIGQASNSSKEVKKSARSVLQCISQRNNWLMVYDGADGHYQTIEKFLPPGNGGNILITSRNVGLKRITETSLKVDNMAEEEAASLLLKSASFDSMSDHDSNLARKLASELGGIPLALDQAGAYMLTSRLGIADYLELYTKHKHELMSSPEFKGASDYDRTTYGTWDISVQKIEKMAVEEDNGQEALAAQSAIRILRTFAFLDPTNIPLQLFKNAAENYMKRSVGEEVKSNRPLSIRLLDHQSLFLSDKGVWEILKFLSGIQVLISFSLIEAHSQLYSMHLLMHGWNRHRVPHEEIINVYHKARALLSCSVDLDYSLDNYAYCKLLAPHVRSNDLHGSELESESIYYEDEYERFSVVFHHVRSWDEAEKLQVDVMNARQRMLGSDHPDTLSSMGHLAFTYGNQGRLDEAEKLQVDVMNASKTKLGLDHPHTLISMGHLASTYGNQGRLGEAEKLEADVMNGRKRKLGSDHPDTLTSMNNLASIYWNQGRFDEAEKLQADVMNARKAKLGLDHPDTLTSMAWMAFIHRNQGRLDEAEKLEVDVMNGRKRKLGSDHPETLTSMGHLASTYENQGRLDEAEKLQVDVMNGRKTKLGSDHPDTLSSMGNLAFTYQSQGRWDEAEKLQVDVMNGRQRKLGSDHPDTLTSMGHLTSTYWNQGRLDEAEKLEVDVMNGLKTKLGSNHPDTLTIMANLALTYWNQGRLDEAHSLLSHAVQAMQTVMGTSHSNVIYYTEELDMLSKAQHHKESPQVVTLVCMHLSFNPVVNPSFLS
jgi:tetratricopeptide (TPR) repeat protein